MCAAHPVNEKAVLRPEAFRPDADHPGRKKAPSPCGLGAWCRSALAGDRALRTPTYERAHALSATEGAPTARTVSGQVLRRELALAAELFSGGHFVPT